jgi:hypothetical protein
VPDFVVVLRKILAEGRAALAVGTTIGTTADGSAYAWEFIQVIQTAADGRARHRDLYADTQWTEALARFDEWTNDADAPPLLENAATRTVLDAIAQMHDGDVEGSVHRFFAEDAIRIARTRDHLPDLTTYDDHVANFHAIFDVFGSMVLRPVAVRGDRVALFEVVLEASGFEQLALAVVEIDGSGRITRIVSFDPDALDAALAELASRHAAIESSVENRATVAGQQARDAALRGDRAAALDVFAPDFTRSEHRTGALSLDAAQHRELYVDGMLAGPNVGLTHFDAVTLETAGDDHALTHLRWHNGEGFAEEWLLVCEVDEHGRLRRIANFDADDRAAASALLHLWVSERGQRPATAPENAVTRRLADYPDRFFAGDWDWVADMMTEAVVNDDRRTGVSAGVVAGRDAVLELTRALAQVGFTSMTNDPLATRGDTLALFRRVWHHPDGFEVPLLALMELDDSDRMIANVMWDVEDLAAAIAEFDRRAPD